MIQASIFLSILASSLALHSLLPTETKKTVYTSFVPPSAERLFAPQIANPTAKAVAAPYQAPYVAPYYPPYAPFTVKQYPYYPPVYQPFYQPQTPVYYVQRYPVPAESGSEQGGSAGGPGWGNFFPSGWPSFPSYWPFTGSGSSESEGSASPATPAEVSQGSANKGKPEKVDATEAPQESGKSDTEKIELPEQQYVVLGQPQFFGHFAAFPADRDPSTLNGATKGAISSFLFYKDQTQQVQPQKLNEIPNVPGSASVAYQRFLLLSKQRSEEGAKPQKIESPVQKETILENSNSTTAETSTKASGSS